MKKKSLKKMKYLIFCINRINTSVLNRKFSTSPNRNAIPPIIWILVKPLSKISSVIIGRGLRKWLAKPENLHRKLKIKEHFKVNKKKYFFVTSGMFAGGYFYYQSHIEETPITNRKRFMLFNSNHLKEIADAEKENILDKFKDKILPVDHKLTRQVLNVAKRLFKANKEFPQVSNIEWKLTVIESKTINACALPNGEIFVFSGLLDFIENEDELAFIMAHEMSHAILQHSAEQFSYTRIIDISYIIIGLIIWTIFPTDSSAFFVDYFSQRLHKFLFELPYSRSLEKEADMVGIKLAAKACFDVRYSPIFWKKMEEMEKMEDKKTKTIELLSTHPSNESRAKDLEGLLFEALKIRDECKCYKLPEQIKQSQKIFNIEKIEK